MKITAIDRSNVEVGLMYYASFADVIKVSDEVGKAIMNQAKGTEYNNRIDCTFEHFNVNMMFAGDEYVILGIYISDENETERVLYQIPPKARDDKAYLLIFLKERD